MNRRALSLVEVLVALAMGALVVAIAAAVGLTTRRWVAMLEVRSIAGQRVVAVPLLLADALAVGGRGLAVCGLAVADGGASVRVMGVERGDAEPSVIEVRAGVDGGGRPALYRRTVPHARQPWLEGVVAFAVLAARDDAGVWRTPEHDGATRWTGLRLRLAWVDGDARNYEVVLPHAPCAEPYP